MILLSKQILGLYLEFARELFVAHDTAKVNARDERLTAEIEVAASRIPECKRGQISYVLLWNRNFL